MENGGAIIKTADFAGRGQTPNGIIARKKLVSAPRFTAFATTEDRLLYQYQNEHRPMFAYYDDSKIIGYYSLSLQDDNECELNNLCVLPQYRHKHIGVKLLENA